MMTTVYGIWRTEVAVEYMRKLLAVELGAGGNVQMPNWELDQLEEIHYAVKMVTQAIKNRSE